MMTPSQPTLRLCPECGGQRVGLPFFEGGLGKHGRWGTEFLGQVKALVCLNCEHTSLHAVNLAAVREEVQKQPQKYEF